ncbi:MAG TPA: Flp family type IVb pilin [Acidiphilium sp.]|uniref:Flp family type IVb pilin n=2 Tax=Acidiphilium TaxID=522 RepID=UPI001F349E57|nr:MULTISPECIES: Flp family type IVb pilin [unclassified Acidiphilium]HQU10938.1 Flp family type IVb pilin [Acidiphilium sp.]
MTMLDYVKTWLAVRGLAFARDDRGVTAMEYGLIAALMAVVIIGAFGLLANDLGNAVNKIGGTLTNNTTNL